MVATFKSSLQNLTPLTTSSKVEPLAKPKTGHKFFENITKPKTKVLPVFGQKLDKSLSFKPKPWLKPFVNTGPWNTVYNVSVALVLPDLHTRFMI